jgi:hypothetical protein
VAPAALVLRGQGMTTNGTHPDPAGLIGHPDFFVRWRRVTELALQEGEKRLQQAKEAIGAAQAAVAQRERELAILRRALRLQAERPLPGTRSARPGVNRAAVFILEVLTVRFRSSGEAGFTTHIVGVACQRFARTTWESGLRQLLADGLVERVGLGRYVLTELGQRQPPATAAALPLAAPREREEVAR